MELNTKENVRCDIKFGDGCSLSMEKKGPDVTRKDFVGFDDSESELGCKDIADLLPNDPFGMEFSVGLPSDPLVMGFEISLPKDPFGMGFDDFKAVTGWIEDFDSKGHEFETDRASENGSNEEDYKVFAGGLNFYWTGSMKYEQEGGGGKVLDSGGDVEDLLCFGSDKYENPVGSNDDEPADALLFAVRYLGIKDLLSVERVCRSFREAVVDDISLWKDIHIDEPLSDKITDDGLLGLTGRAKGNLSSLSLSWCWKITNSGLKHVLERNPGLTRLSVQGRTHLHTEGILHDLKVFNSFATPGIKRLRLGQLLGLTNHQFTEFKHLLGVDEDKKAGNYKPRFFRAGEIDLSLDDERPIDIETCPRCQQARQVYDCPSESCREKIHSPTEACRGCVLCISRCVNCGSCLFNKVYEETFCLDSICLDCLNQLFNRNDSSHQTYFYQKASYQFLVCS